jgi:hypothetical protein
LYLEDVKCDFMPEKILDIDVNNNLTSCPFKGFSSKKFAKIC